MQLVALEPPRRQDQLLASSSFKQGRLLRGQVGVRLVGADVIHSFWAPALTGKTDLIPGQINVTWIEASNPGVLPGRCAEFCGLQHAHMAFAVVAQPPSDFDSWWDHQLTGAPAVASADFVRGNALFLARCGARHSVRGTAAGGTVGSDLTHVMGRRTLAAGTLPSTSGHLAGPLRRGADPHPALRGDIEVTSA
jgi:cytochrome c oxidase subunit 2